MRNLKVHQQRSNHKNTLLTKVGKKYVCLFQTDSSRLSRRLHRVYLTPRLPIINDTPTTQRPAVGRARGRGRGTATTRYIRGRGRGSDRGRGRGNNRGRGRENNRGRGRGRGQTQSSPSSSENDESPRSPVDREIWNSSGTPSSNELSSSPYRSPSTQRGSRNRSRIQPNQRGRRLQM